MNQKLDTFTREFFQRARQSHGHILKSIHTRPIAPKKAMGAAKYAAAHPDDMVLVHDATILGSAKRGFCVTSSNLYCNEFKKPLDINQMTSLDMKYTVITDHYDTKLKSNFLLDGQSTGMEFFSIAEAFIIEEYIDCLKHGIHMLREDFFEALENPSRLCAPLLALPEKKWHCIDDPALLQLVGWAIDEQCVAAGNSWLFTNHRLILQHPSPIKIIPLSEIVAVRNERYTINTRLPPGVGGGAGELLSALGKIFNIVNEERTIKIETAAKRTFELRDIRPENAQAFMAAAVARGTRIG